MKRTLLLIAAAFAMTSSFAQTSSFRAHTAQSAAVAKPAHHTRAKTSHHRKHSRKAKAVDASRKSNRLGSGYIPITGPGSTVPSGAAGKRTFAHKVLSVSQGEDFQSKFKLSKDWTGEHMSEVVMFQEYEPGDQPPLSNYWDSLSVTLTHHANSPWVDWKTVNQSSNTQFFAGKTYWVMVTVFDGGSDGQEIAASSHIYKVVVKK